MIDFLRSHSLTWWLAISAILYVLAANLSWRWQAWTGERALRLASALRRLVGSPLAAIGSFSYNIGVPYAALLLGILDPRAAGLVAPDWLRSLGIGAGMAVATTGLLALDRARLRKPSTPPDTDTAYTSVGAALWRAVFQQAHLGFYRGVLAPLLGAYTGSCAALGIVLGEWLLNPAWRASWAREPLQCALAFDLALVLTTTILFILTNNVWVCLAVHALLALIFRPSFQAPLNSVQTGESV